MAELENDVEETTYDDVEETMAEDYQEEDNQETNDEITYEQALEWKKKAERLEKAEKRLVELKKASKTQPKNESIDPKKEFERLWEEKEFYKTNPDAITYKDKIDEFLEKGLSLKNAYILASQDDKEIEENRKVYGQSIIRGNTTSNEGVKLVDITTYDSMSEDQQNKYNSDTKSKFGAVRFK